MLFVLILQLLREKKNKKNVAGKNVQFNETNGAIRE